MTQKCVKNESFCPCSDTLRLKWVKWFIRGFQWYNHPKFTWKVADSKSHSPENSSFVVFYFKHRFSYFLSKWTWIVSFIFQKTEVLFCFILFCFALFCFAFFCFALFCFFVFLTFNTDFHISVKMDLDRPMINHFFLKWKVSFTSQKIPFL